ncbi:hypothetical protein AY601_1356 [Pedobacter cryoconitis]|uniref:Uncharacterized protein n=1 Tax=Pedobacter cryoconitis TaxID=188932 RepID=A0A127VAD9_9SPHI|nr:hypothetical protein [Pedobacter cryoconitis]AMP98274.1 hypothetical protein AY601_1356 [Pedobacter cryoconitis]
MIVPTGTEKIFNMPRTHKDSKIVYHTPIGMYCATGFLPGGDQIRERILLLDPQHLDQLLENIKAMN